MLGLPDADGDVTEYLEQLLASGIEPADLPVVQPLYQHRSWRQLASAAAPDRLADAAAATGARASGPATAPSWSVPPPEIVTHLDT